MSLDTTFRRFAADNNENQIKSRPPHRHLLGAISVLALISSGGGYKVKFCFVAEQKRNLWWMEDP